MLRFTHMKNITTAIVVVLAVLVAGFFLLNSFIYEEKQADTSIYSMGVYGYRCADGTEFTMSVPKDMGTILITPASDVDRIQELILTRGESEAGVLFEGDGISFRGQGEKVSLTGADFSTECLPMQSDGAPFNFGD